MKIVTNRIILSCVFLCLSLVLNTNCEGQARSILLTQTDGTRVAQRSQDELSPPNARRLVMQVNQPSSNSPIMATSHMEETEELPRAASVTMTQLDEAQYGSPIAPGVAVFEVKNFGSEDAHDVNVEIAVENSARMLSIEPRSTIIASKAARVHLGSISAGQSKIVKVQAASGNGSPVQYTTQVVLESEQQFVSSMASHAALPANPIPRNPVPREPGLSEPVPGTATDLEPLAEAADDEAISLFAEPIAASTNENLPQEAPIVVKIETPKQFVLGVPYRVYATVQNPSGSALKNLQISLRASSHLRSTPGFASFQTAARLESHHAARFEFEIFGVEPGDAEFFVGATAKFEADEGTEIVEATNPLIQLGSSEIIEVYKPAIRANFNGPEVVHVGTEATYGIEVINESGSPMAVTDVLLNVPQHLIVTVLDRIAYKRSTGQIRWRVENLEPGKSELIQFKAKAMQPGMQTQQVDLEIQNRVFAQSTCETNILGPSKLQIELRDLYSAVPIGEIAKLKVNVKNHDDYTNELRLRVRLPEGVHAVNSENLQSNERNEVLFKPFVVDAKSEVQLEIPLVGSVIGGQAIQATVTSNTSLISRTTNRVVIFVNPRDAQYGSVVDTGPPMTAEPVVPAPVLTEPLDPVANVAKSYDAARVSARPASEFSSARLPSNNRHQHESHAIVPEPTQPSDQQEPELSSTSLDPRGYAEPEVVETQLNRGLPARAQPLIASQNTNPNETYPPTNSEAHSNSNRRQPYTIRPAAMLPSSTRPLIAQPASTSIFNNNR